MQEDFEVSLLSISLTLTYSLMSIESPSMREDGCTRSTAFFTNQVSILSHFSAFNSFMTICSHTIFSMCLFQYSMRLTLETASYFSYCADIRSVHAGPLCSKQCSRMLSMRIYRGSQKRSYSSRQCVQILSVIPAMVCLVQWSLQKMFPHFLQWCFPRVRKLNLSWHY